MAGFIQIMGSIGRACVRVGGRLIAALVPGGEVIYEVAASALEDYRKTHSESDLKAELEALAQASQAKVQEAAEIVVAAEAAGQSPEISSNLASYLTSIPAAIRQSTRRPSDPSGGTIPAGRPMSRPEDLMRLLPSGLPRFKPGDRPLAADWELVELLGKGGFGEVWKAKHLARSRQKPVALKFCLDADTAHTLRNEASLLDELERVREEGTVHGFVPLMDTYLRAEPPCLMYELIEGGTLAGLMEDRISQGRLSPAFAADIIHRLASILASAHRMSPPLVHRDLKPSNVLVRKGEGDAFSLFVADFGIGGLAARQSLKEEATRRTVRGVPSGSIGGYTHLYASPQQIQGDRPDPRDDVHALGVLWYQLLTGNLGLLTIPPDWQSVVEDCVVPAKHVQLLASCIASRVEKRLASAAALAEGLADWKRYYLPKIEVRVPGKWLARPTNADDSAWTHVQDLPGVVSPRKGEEYKLSVKADEPDSALAGFGALTGLEELHTVDLVHCDRVTDNGLTHLSGLAPLRSLDLRGCTQVTDAGLVHLQNLTSLRCLNLALCEVTYDGLIDLRDMRMLASLNLEGCPRIDNNALLEIQALSAIRSLSLCNTQITDDGTPCLLKLTELQHLDLSCCRLTDDSLLCLASLTSLQSLSVGNIYITDSGLAHLKALTKLRYLSINYAYITDDGLHCFKHLVALVYLDLRSCAGLSADGLSNLQEALPFTHIRHELWKSPIAETGNPFASQADFPKRFTHCYVDINGECLVGSAGLHQNKWDQFDLPSIIFFDRSTIIDIQIHNDGLEGLRDLPGDFPLRRLDCTAEALTGTDLSYMKHLKHLKDINLYGCSWLRDDDVGNLSEMKGLESIDLRECGFSQAAVDQLQEALPECEILSDDE